MLTIVNVNLFSIYVQRLTIVNLFSIYVSYKDFWIITLIILLGVYILEMSKHLIMIGLHEDKKSTHTRFLFIHENIAYKTFINWKSW